MKGVISTYDVIIIGSGAGGATVAMEMAKKGRKVLVLEKGSNYDHFGDLKDIIQFQDASPDTRKERISTEGTLLLRAFTAGGSTVVSCGNGMRCLEKELADFGINLEEEFNEAEQELKITPIPQESLSEGSKAILTASREFGYQMQSMPKFVDTSYCSSCGNCFAGCDYKAKWTALDFLEEAKSFGAELRFNTTVHKIKISKGKAIGVVIGRDTQQSEIYADKIIVSAGGLSTPLILHQSGINGIGKGLFVDTFVNVYGVTDGLNQINECPMSLVDLEFYNTDGFILSTFINPIKLSLFAEIDNKAFNISTENLIGLMVKIRDDRSGFIQADGEISKPLTQQDQARLHKGIEIAREILVQAGANRSSIIVSKLQGAHPGGTAAIGEVVNERLETPVKNLYVCDGSVLPASPGLPPILTIVALAKRLAKNIAWPDR